MNLDEMEDLYLHLSSHTKLLDFLAWEISDIDENNINYAGVYAHILGLACDRLEEVSQMLDRYIDAERAKIRKQELLEQNINDE